MNVLEKSPLKMTKKGIIGVRLLYHLEALWAFDVHFFLLPYQTNILCEGYVSIIDEIYIKEIGLCAEGWPMVIGVRSCNKKEKNTHLPNSCCVHAKTKSIIRWMGVTMWMKNGRNCKYCIHLGDSLVEGWIIAPKSETWPAQIKQ